MSALLADPAVNEVVAGALIAELLACGDGHTRDLIHVSSADAPHTSTLREAFMVTPAGLLYERSSAKVGG